MHAFLLFIGIFNKSRYSERNCDLFFSFLSDKVPIIDNDMKNISEVEITISELDIHPQRTDGITIEFYKHFLEDIRILLTEALKDYINKTELSTTTKHGLMILIPKSNKDKLFSGNWRAITHYS